MVTFKTLKRNGPAKDVRPRVVVLNIFFFYRCVIKSVTKLEVVSVYWFSGFRGMFVEEKISTEVCRFIDL